MRRGFRPLRTTTTATGCGWRIQSEGDGYYLLISGDGFYSILKGEAEDFQPLVDWAGSDVIRQGNATNQICAVCDGATLTLFVNGQQLTTAEDDTFSDGDVSLSATSYEDEPTEIYFDTSVAREP